MATDSAPSPYRALSAQYGSLPPKVRPEPISDCRYSAGSSRRWCISLSKASVLKSIIRSR